MASPVASPTNPTPASPDAALIAGMHARGIGALVCDGVADGAVLRHASAMASALAAPLAIVRVLEPLEHSAPVDPVDWDLRVREVKRQLEVLRSSPSACTATEVGTEVLQGRVTQQIPRWAATHNVDLLVVGTIDAETGTRSSLGGTAHTLLAGSSLSLLLVPPSESSAKEPCRYERILVPLDGSPRAESALPVAAQLARHHRAELLLAHAVPSGELTQIGPLSSEDLEIQQQLTRRNERVARGYLERMRARAHEAGGAARGVVLRDGDVRRQLAGLMERECVDLVILSAHGHGASDAPCGSVAAYLLARGDVPVLVRQDAPPCRPPTGVARLPVQADFQRNVHATR